MLSSNDKIKIRMRIIIYAVFVPMAIYIAVGMYFLQVHHHKEYLEKARKRYVKKVESSGQRGKIYSDNGTLLVSNVPCFNVSVDPDYIYQKDKKGNLRVRVAYVLSQFTKKPYKEIFDKLSPLRPVYDKNHQIVYDENGKAKMQPSKYVMIARNVSLEEGQTLLNDLRKYKANRGVIFQSTYKRYYVKNSLLSSVLGLTGYRGDEEFGVSGIELAMNKEISPTVSKNYYEAGRDGRKLSYGKIDDYTEVKDGKNVYLTINEPLQSFVEQELDRLMEEYKPKAVYAIMINPHNGNVLAIAQRPTFNPNDRSSLNAKSSNMRFLTDVYEPGSIIKPFTIAHAIDRGIVTPDTLIDCEDGYWVYLRRPMKDSHNIPVVSVTEVLKQSSNIGTAKIALMLGDQAVHDNLVKFGFGKKSNFILQPESKGIFHGMSAYKRDKLLVTRVPIGYGVAVTPIQMVRAYGALANGGTLLPLRLIDQIEDPETGEITEMPYEKGVKVFENESTAETMKYMLSQVTRKGGTASKARVEGFNIAGKTGTARKKINGAYTTKYFASFVGFAPAEEPEFVLLLSVDEPNGRSYYGGSVAGPTFSRICEKSLKYLNIDPEAVTRYKYDEEEK
ncbi:MAG: penicillin-binding protein 2 [Lentisphaeria bacterium]|nr:penicillin-binding protein 2 [Lentisphaeria bacterium]